MKTRHTLSTSPLSRRQFAQAALAGAAVLLLPASPSAAEANAPIDASPAALPTTGESSLLIQSVPINVGYTLTPTQAKEVAAQLQDYSSDAAKVRAYAIPDSVEPAFAATAPARMERGK